MKIRLYPIAYRQVEIHICPNSSILELIWYHHLIEAGAAFRID